MIKLVVIADDLTGALDTGVQFAKKKISTLVTSNLNYDEKYNDYSVVVINTESRHLSPIQAKKIVKNILLDFSDKGISFFYKKIDSTLRGNIGSEIEGFIEGLKIQKLSLIPAFPLGNRTVKDGILYVDRIPLSETQFSRDILNPVKDSYIPDILEKQTSIKSTLKDKTSILSNLINSEKEIFVFDALTMIDLKNIGESLFRKNLLKYTAGSAGFAEILADYIEAEYWNNKILIDNDRCLFVCGSVNEISLKQCTYAETLGYNKETLNFKKIISHNCKELSGYMISNTDFKKKMEENKNILIKTCDSKNVIKETIDYAKINNLSIKTLTSNISNNTGQFVADLIFEYDLKNLIVFGGDTLTGILKKINCNYIIPLEEIVPGVVLTRAIYDNKFINIITKAGGFGDEDIIEKINSFMSLHLKILDKEKFNIV